MGGERDEELSIRPAEPGDIDAIREAMIASINALGATDYDDRQVQAWAHIDPNHRFRIEEPNHVTIVAETEAGAIVGFGDVAPSDCELFAVYIHPNHAQKGIGTAIRKHLETAARKRGCEKVELTASKNAVDFYTQAGYERIEPVGHEPTGPQDVVLECLRMDKRFDESA